MPKRRLSSRVREHLAKARESALAAVAAYNNPTAHFRSGTYIVLMIIAWTALFHAVAYQRGQRPWVILKGKGRGTRYDRANGDYRHWDLHHCLNFYFGGDASPVAANLRFLIGLRDRIEHRDMPELDAEVFGECQASLINFERLIIEEFGEHYAINTSLVWSLQFSYTSPPELRHARDRLRKSAAGTVIEYVERFRSDLNIDIESNQEFSFKVYMVPQLANHRSRNALAVEFIHYDPKNETSMRDYEKAVVLLKERHVAVRNPASLLPTGVVQKVSSQIPWQFNIYHHTQCWRFFEVRPSEGVSEPEKTKIEYCQWDTAFKGYVYTEAWVVKIADELSTARRFEEITGKVPVERNLAS